MSATVPESNEGIVRGSATFRSRLPAEHAARVVVGRWRYTLTDTEACPRDALRSCRAVSPAEARREVSGWVSFSDSLLQRSVVRGIGRSSIPRFDLVLGRRVSCTDPDWGLAGVYPEGDSLGISFTPQAADCGVSATVSQRGDTLVGTWIEHGFAGRGAQGRIRMVRDARDQRD